MSENERTHVVVLECPMSWCDQRFIGEGDSETAEVEAASQLSGHVNGDHSERDIDTLRVIDE